MNSIASGVDSPGEPTVREATYETEYGITLTARVYAAEDELGTCRVTVVDWRETPALHTARYEACLGATGDRRGEVTYFGQMDTAEVEGVRVHLLDEDGARTYGVATGTKATSISSRRLRLRAHGRRTPSRCRSPSSTKPAGGWVTRRDPRRSCRARSAAREWPARVYFEVRLRRHACRRLQRIRPAACRQPGPWVPAGCRLDPAWH